MANKKTYIMLSLLSSAFIVGCKGGGSTPTEKKVTSISVGLKDENKKFYFGGQANKDDFVVKLTYNDGSTETLSNDKYKVVEQKGFVTHEINFPFTFEYDSHMSLFGKDWTFIINDGSQAKSFEIKPIKKYKFEYGNGESNIFEVYNSSATPKNIENKIIDTDTGKYATATYSSNKQDVTVSAAGVVSMSTKNFSATTITAFIDNVCVDKYYIEPFQKNVTGMELKAHSSVICSAATKTDFDPNNDGTLHIPSVWDGDFVTQISYNGSDFSGCTKLTELYLPESLLNIGDNSFKDCSKLNKNITIPSGVHMIGYNSFVNCNSATFDFDYVDGWRWASEGSTGVVPSEYIKKRENATKLLLTEDIFLFNTII